MRPGLPVTLTLSLALTLTLALALTPTLTPTLTPALTPTLSLTLTLTPTLHQGSLLDDEELVLTLQSSKTTSVEVTNQLAISEQTEKKIDAAREGYRPCAYRASILYFLLADLARVDPMYQFSLDAYVSLFTISLDKSARSDDLQERIKSLNEYHTFFVYRSTCRALFEMHKLLFAFQICAKILLGAKKMNQAEHDFFLRGGQVFNNGQPL